MNPKKKKSNPFRCKKKKWKEKISVKLRSHVKICIKSKQQREGFSKKIHLYCTSTTQRYYSFIVWETEKLLGTKKITLFFFISFWFQLLYKVMNFSTGTKIKDMKKGFPEQVQPAEECFLSGCEDRKLNCPS